MAPSSASVKSDSPASSRRRRLMISRACSVRNATTSRLRSAEAISLLFHNYVLTQHGDETMERFRRRRLVLHHGDADEVRAGIRAVGLLAREIATGDDTHTGLLPQALGHDL